MPEALIELMELGALMNDRFDGDDYDPAALSAGMAWFARSAHRDVVWKYARRLRQVERTRPDPDEGMIAVKCYRESVNRVSLAALWALAYDKTLENAELDLASDRDLGLLFKIVMILQMIDDLMDVNTDRGKRLPSFTTVPDVTTVRLRAQVTAYANAGQFCFDRNFCLHVTLKLMAASAHVMISLRAASGLFPLLRSA